MLKKHLKTLEYDKILEILAIFSKTYLGNKLCLELEPFYQEDTVRKMLAQTEESIRLRFQNGSCPLVPIKDISIYIKKLESNQILSASALLQISQILKLSRELKQYFYRDDLFDSTSYPLLASLFDSLYTNPAIEDRIFTSILDENSIADEASNTLREIRRKIRNQESEIKEQLSSVLHSYSKYIQDSVITLRNDRYVIPVKEEYRGMIRGFVHDISASGSTIFIEPLSVFEKNNKITELKAEESMEIEKILEALSSLLTPITEQLENSLMIIGKLDFCFAKAEYAISTNSIIPTLHEEKQISLFGARHPLIDSSKVVPIDITLGNDFSCLVITGPNTGGKTVTLKTVGLLCLMAMSGLAIPASENSSIHVFDHIFADIGDEQSIGESLSTFSSHLVTIVQITKEVTENSLILVDELGSGTDPIEGSGLAISILEYFHHKNALILATTHYPEIKNYALVTQGFENASCEFDVETLSPTYKLLIGVPGKSNAFAISKRLGLEDSILQRATDFIEKDTISIEELLKNIYDNKKKIEEEKEEIDKNLSQITNLRKSLERDTSHLQEKEEEIIQKAKKEAREILLSAKEKSSQLIREMNSLTSSDSRKNLEHIRNSLTDSIKSLSTYSIKEDKVQLSPDTIHVGDEVFVKSFQQNGIILSLPNNSNQLQVQIGSIKVNISVSDIAVKKQVNSSKSIPSTSNKNTILKSQKVSTEINVIGQNVEEATFVIDKYLDDCVLSHLSPVRIVHGKGTGKLREGIHTFLKKHPHVKSFRLGTFGEGETGVTIVELK